jgi:phosphate transport system substrate-binding protein
VAQLPAQPPVHAPAPPAAQPVTTVLRIHGSNTIGARLMQGLVKAYMEHNNYRDVHVEPTDKLDLVYVVGRLGATTARIEIVAHGSETGFPDLAAGIADIAMSSEKIDERHLKELAAMGDLSSRAGEHVIALDGVSVIVHALNRVSALSLAQLAAVVGGDVKDWSKVGGASGPIAVYARDDNSGTWRFFNDAVLQRFGRTLRSDARRFESSQELSDAVAQDPQGIGIIGLTYVGPNKVLGLSDQDVQARVPSVCTIKTEEYLLTRRLYLYTSTRMEGEVPRFITFATSRQAWPIESEAGVMSLDPRPLLNCNAAGAVQHSQAWRKLTRGARRLLVNFHFLPGSDRLDNEAYLSMDYFIPLLTSPGFGQKQKLVLIGYADGRGSARENQRLSEDRATAVWKELSARLESAGLGGMLDRPTGLGAQDFLATNDTPEGRERNRRVEVWLR